MVLGVAVGQAAAPEVRLNPLRDARIIDAAFRRVMPVQTVYTTTKSLGGPWLITRAALDELDALFAGWFREELGEHTKRFDHEFQHALAELTKHGQNHPDTEALAKDMALRRCHEPKLRVTLKLNSEKSLVGESLRDLTSNAETLAAAPSGFEFSLRGGVARPEMSLRMDRESALRIEVDGPRPLRESYFVALHDWAEKQRQPAVVRWWHEYGRALGCLMIFLLPSILGIVASPPSGPDAVLIRRATQLAAQGVAAATRDEALTLLLSLQTSREHGSTGWSELPFGAVIFFVAAIALAVVLILRPSSAVGIGAGVGRLRRTQLWIRTVLIGTPTLVVVPYVVNKLSDVL